MVLSTSFKQGIRFATYEKILDVQARLIANKQTFYTKEDSIYEFLSEIGVIE